MSQALVTNDDRVQALRQFGYTEREAAFLCLAALHGGYFLRRQYVYFLGKSAGGNAAILIEKVVANEHAIASTYANNVHVYHLCTRPFYAALGETDNRNRRPRQPLSIKNRLMALDFVLKHKDHSYLATEREKLEYFTQVLKVERDALPVKRYRATNGSQLSDRYFVDKNPIFVAAALERSEVGFCFIDAGATTVSGFETYLGQYRLLFEALQEFCVIYVAARPHLFKAAERTFSRFACGPNSEHRRASSPHLLPQIREYFVLRDLFESGRRDSFDRQKLVRLRDLRERFAEPENEAQYNAWKANRPLPAGDSQRQSAPPVQIFGRFSTCLLEQNYDFFGNLTAL